MAWQDYWATQTDGIEEIEQHADHTWEAVLLLLLLAERQLRKQAILILDRYPLGRDGLVNYRRWREIRRQHNALARMADLNQRAITKALTGVDPRKPAPGWLSRRPNGRIPSAIRRASTIATRAINRGIARIRRDSSGAPHVATPQGKASPAASAPTKAGGAASSTTQKPGVPGGPVARERRDVAEVTLDQVLNPIRNVRYEVDRFVEQIRQNVTPNKPLSVARETIVGSQRGAEPWHLNRNVAKQSTVPHIRAMHRRRVISEALANGIDAFRMELPRSLLGHFAKHGVMGPHLWRVRRLSEWLALDRAINAARQRTSGWDTLGLGFGDLSYLVAVPAIYLADAIAQGRELRRQWIGGDDE